MTLSTPLGRARLSLDGLSIGDAFGERFFVHPDQFRALVEARALPKGPWRWTDDTAMALGLCEVLDELGTLDGPRLARAFGTRFRAQPDRGYGRAAQEILHFLAEGVDWKLAASAPFDGTGSKGNGGAMRASVVGAFFAPDLERVIVEARRSAIVTHFHPDGQTGAIAVALAAALAWNEPGASAERTFAFLLQHLPRTETTAGLERAAALGALAPERAAEILGSGQRVLSEDTVPFAIWSAAHHTDFVEALWATVAGGGDRDTTCAMVGGIVALKARAVPELWRREREPLA